MTYPEEVWDIAWKFNPNVVIRPSQETFIFDTAHPGYDISITEMLEEVLSKDPYIPLNDEEIDKIIHSIT
jgi:hypothetical protein